MSKKKKYPGRYNPDWENSDLNPDLADWIQPVKTGKSDDIHYFSCKVCKTGRLSISTMGILAPRSHVTDRVNKKGEKILSKHNRLIKQINCSKKDSFESFKVHERSVSQSNSSHEIEVLELPETTSENPKIQNEVTAYLNNAPRDVLNAWILWCLNTVYHHVSYNSAGNQGELFRKMFPDSDIARKFGTLSRNKISYIVSHGLSYYFKNMIMSEISPAEPRLRPVFVSCFDESFNDVTYTKQMDIHILFF